MPKMQYSLKVHLENSDVIEGNAGHFELRVTFVCHSYKSHKCWKCSALLTLDNEFTIVLHTGG